MSRVFWDTDVFLHLAGAGARAARAAALGRWMAGRGDELATSALTLGELLGACGPAGPRFAAALAGGATLLPFDADAAARFAALRREAGLGTADAIQLACAASGAADLFVAGDERLAGLHVPGIGFIQSLERAAP